MAGEGPSGVGVGRQAVLQPGRQHLGGEGRCQGAGRGGGASSDKEAKVERAAKRTGKGGARARQVVSARVYCN